MAGTLPAASDESAFGVAVSNLIEVTQTRSAYGQVMNKRAAAGDRSSDTNDRSEPCVHVPVHPTEWPLCCCCRACAFSKFETVPVRRYVGSRVVLRMYEDALGTPREAVMRWVVELLYPTLFGWNQWAWRGRRYVLVCRAGVALGHSINSR